MDTLLELFTFLRYRRKFWLWPLVIIFVAMGIFIAVAQSSALGPLLYSLF
jgi:hypothetical protein